MARTLHVYPKAIIDGSEWTYVVKVGASRFTHTIPSGVAADVPMRLLKLSYDLTVADTDTDEDVDDAHWSDTASGGPTSGETLWETWQALAEVNLTAAGSPHTQAGLYAEWSKQNTQRIRQAGNRILVNGRGWTIANVHQHEGDGTNTDE